MRIPVFVQLPADLPAGAAPGPPGRAFGRVLATLQAWRLERRTLGQLRRLDDATLRDIGMDRWQLEQAVRSEVERMLLRRTP